VTQTIFITDFAWPNLDYERQQFEAAGHRLVAGRSAALPREEIEAIAERERPQAIMTCWAQVSATAIGHCRDLAIVARYGVGLDNIALDAAWAAGARVTNVPDYCVEEVSDHAVAMLLAWSRGIVQWDREVKRGHWNPALAQLKRTRGLTVGLVGYGRAGKLIARKLSGWGLRTIACGRTAPTGQDAARVEWMTMAALLPQADVVIALVPLSPATANLFDAPELGALSPDQREQQQQCRAGAQPHQLPDRIGRDHVLAERIAEREHEDRQQHQPDAGQPRGALVIAGDFAEQAHEG